MSKLERKLSLGVTAGHEPLTLAERPTPTQTEINTKVDAILEEKGNLGRLMSWVDRKVSTFLQTYFGGLDCPESDKAA